MLIDEVLPAWHKRERHRRRTDAGAGELLRAAEELTWQDVAVFRTLMRVRAGGRRIGGATILSGMMGIGFLELHAVRGRSCTAGSVGRGFSRPEAGPDRQRDPRKSFVDFARPGYAKMAFNFAVDGDEFTTETRVFMTDAPARRSFGAYWLVIRPFSGLIRREWLAGIVRLAARTGQAHQA